MLLLGLLLIAVAVAAVVAAIFATDSTELTYLGFDISPLALFLIGVGAVVALGFGLRLSRFVVKRDFRRRKEARRLAKEAEQREKAGAEASSSEER